MIKLFQTYYNDHQKNNLLEGFTPYLNEEKSILVENKCIFDIRHKFPMEDTSYVGVFSYKLHEKILSRPTFKTMSECISSNSDVDIFSNNINNLWWGPLRIPQPIYFPNQCNMKDLAIPLLTDLADLGVIKQSSIALWTKVYDKPIFCNFWVAKSSIFTDYVDNFLVKVFDLVDSYDKNHCVFTPDVGYPSEPPPEWQQATGLSHYPIITFILERLINIYMLDKNLNHQAIL